MIVLLLAVSAPLAMMLLHVALQRTLYAAGEPRTRLGLVIRIVMGVTVIWGVLAVIVFGRLPLPLLVLNVGYAMVVSFGLGMCYFNVFALSETALRIRLLMESYIAEERGETASVTGTVVPHDAATMIRVRIDRLIAMRAAVEQDGKIVVVSAPLLLTAKIFHNARSVWRAVLFGSQADERTFDAWKSR